MRVLYLHQYFNTPEMSGGTRSYEMARRLVNSGHEVHMITTDRDPKTSRSGWYTTEEAGIVVHWLPLSYSNHMSYVQRIRAFFRFAWRAAKRAANIPTDVVFATSTPLTIALPAVYAARCQKTPMVLEVRDVWPEVPIALGVLKGPMIPAAKLLETFAYRNATRIVALSPDMKRSIAARGVPDEFIHVIPNGCDLDLFTILSEKGKEFRKQHIWLQDRPLIIYTGTLGLVNGVSYFVQIAAELEKIEPSICCLVVGTGLEEKYVRSLASDLGVLNRNFFMWPPLPKKEVPIMLSASNIATSFVVNEPALWANSANKFFDTLAAGRPIVINHRGWQAELIESTKVGIVLPPDNAQEAAQLLWSFLRDEERLESAGVMARSLAKTRFHRDKLATELEGVLMLAVENGSICDDVNRKDTRY